MLFIRDIKGANPLPNPPLKMDIAVKKILQMLQLLQLYYRFSREPDKDKTVNVTK
jgi:hypothetical protein